MRKFSLLFSSIVLIAGCRESSKIASVAGTVKLDGKPLPNASVSFQPIGEGRLNPGPGSTGLTDDKGEYTLVVTGGGSGAVVGMHRVEISCPTDRGKYRPEDDRRPRPRERVPLHYNAQSTLSFEVKPGKNTANFELLSK